MRGEPGRTAPNVLARSESWSVADVVCTSGAADRVFEEQHTHYSIAVVLTGTFQYRSRAGHAVMTPGSLMLGSPEQCFECGHEHAEGDRCVSFWYSPEYFERLVSDAGLANYNAAAIPRIPPVRTRAPIVAAVAANVVGVTHARWDEIGVGLAANAVALANGVTVCHRTPVNAEAGVTRVVRWLGQSPHASSTLDEMAREAGLSPYHFLRNVFNVSPASRLTNSCCGRGCARRPFDSCRADRRSSTWHWIAALKISRPSIVPPVPSSNSVLGRTGFAHADVTRSAPV